MTDLKVPVEPRVSLGFQERRRLFKGIAGGDLDPETRLELLAGRKVQALARLERRTLAALRRQRERATAVARRRKARVLAAEYARDRRASGESPALSKRERRRLRTRDRLANRGRQAST